MTHVDMVKLDPWWEEAKKCDDIHRLAAIGNVFLDSCSLPGTHGDYTLLARVQWIVARIEFLRIARSLEIHKREDPYKPARSGYNEPLIPVSSVPGFVAGIHEPPVLTQTDTVPVEACAVSLVETPHPPHTWMKQYAIEDNKPDELYWCVGS